MVNESGDVAPTTQVTVTRTLDGGPMLTAHLNGKTLGFSQDVAHAVVGVGQTNTLDWIVVGPPGSSYTIAVTSPPGAACSGGSQLDQDGRDAGSCDFNT